MYCENAICDKKGTYNIELVSNTNDFRGVFGEVLGTVKDTFGDLLQLLTNLKNKKIEFDFHKKINYGLPFGIIFIAGNSDNPIDIDNKTKKIDIINAINQKKRVVLDHAQIDDIQYNVLDNAFYFIFDIGNPSQLAIKVPRKYLENDELPIQ